MQTNIHIIKYDFVSCNVYVFKQYSWVELFDKTVFTLVFNLGVGALLTLIRKTCSQNVMDHRTCFKIHMFVHKRFLDNSNVFKCGSNNWFQRNWSSKNICVFYGSPCIVVTTYSNEVYDSLNESWKSIDHHIYVSSLSKVMPWFYVSSYFSNDNYSQYFVKILKNLSLLKPYIFGLLGKFLFLVVQSWSSEMIC